MHWLSRLGKNLWILIAAPIIAYAGGAMLTGSWTPWKSNGPPLQRTDVRFLTPTGVVGARSQFRITARKRGTCSDISYVDAAPEVVRCYSGNYIYSTCWGAYSPSVLCIESPWSRDALELDVRAYFFTVGRPSKLRSVAWNPSGKKQPPITRKDTRASPDLARTEPPWALELTNGQRCLAADGATGVIAGQRASYLCTTNGLYNEHAPNGWVIGYPDKSSKLWRVEYLGPAAVSTVGVNVVAAWY